MAALVWNVVLVIDIILKDIKRGYNKKLKSIKRNDKKRIEMGKKAIFSSSKYNIDEIMPLWDTLFKNIKTKSNSWF